VTTLLLILILSMLALEGCGDPVEPTESERMIPKRHWQGEIRDPEWEEGYTPPRMNVIDPENPKYDRPTESAEPDTNRGGRR